MNLVTVLGAANGAAQGNTMQQIISMVVVYGAIIAIFYFFRF